MSSYCECRKQAAFFRRRKNGEKRWEPAAKNDHEHELCPRCWRALFDSIRARVVPEIRRFD